MTTIRNNARLETADDTLWCDDCGEVIDEGDEFYEGNLKNLCLDCGQRAAKEQA